MAARRSGWLARLGRDDRRDGPLLRLGFLIQAERGQGGEHLSTEYDSVAGADSQLWIRDSGHVAGYGADPEEYERRVTGFFDDALLAGRWRGTAGSTGRDGGGPGAVRGRRTVTLGV